MVQTVRNNVTIDWTLQENVRARLLVRRTPTRYGISARQAGKATLTVLEQVEVLSEG